MAELERRSAAAMTDALGVLHHQTNVLDRVSWTPGRVLFGVAVTSGSFPLGRICSKRRRTASRDVSMPRSGTSRMGIVVFDSAGYITRKL
jgi:hypothetical protein